MTNKGVSTTTGILVILAVAIVAGALIWWQMGDQAASVPNDWKTYTSTDHPYDYEPDFSFQYPPGLEVRELYEFITGEDEPHRGLSLVGLEDSSVHLDIDNEFWVGHSVPIDHSTKKIDTVQLGSVMAEKTTAFEVQGETWIVMYEFVYNGHEYVTTISPEEVEIFEKIISTLE